MERTPAEGWDEHHGHIARYAFAASRTLPGETVNDIACGSGYGSLIFSGHAAYCGYDKPGVPSTTMPGMFRGVDLDDPEWAPDLADVTVCFETLEHVKDPVRLARVITETTLRAIFVSVPVVPTKHMNPYHLHDFTGNEIPPMFPGFETVTEWPQPEELSHVWYLQRIPS